jgi:hypothetical protein
MAASTTLLWGLSTVTFIVALFAVIDQSTLHQELASQVFRFDGNGTASLAPGIRRVVIGPELPPNGIESVPTGSVYIGSAIRFSSGHSMERDGSGNLVLFAEATPGFRTRLATFTPKGAVSLGEIAPPDDADGNVFVVGRAIASARDGWMMHAISNVTDHLGRVFATMGPVQGIEDPTESGIQFRTGDSTLTFSNGRVYVGFVSDSMKKASPNAKVLVGGDVVVESELTQLKLPVTSIDPPDCPEYGYVRVQNFTNSATYQNGNASDLSTTYFLPTALYTSTVVREVFSKPSIPLGLSNISLNCTIHGISTSLTTVSISLSATLNTNPFISCWCPLNAFEITSFAAPTA